ncbi:TP53-binding protein 1 [Brienomyrus brachyistius]|uniref:TP53-binding protein 1 n=1 Tax=Brienomyrus brachyistius TaxID=42636 RepID=UPI0020B30F49|nr:TP53-binding protein 1 [Brienomyrus brachyistius]XP_048887020.1 TP53-binding protein 1 [Brienomyrus brachyistius]XP_048887021.1 TP53-binding protein 1 [Brienomyrus brachyistius]XP_048887022.1 TP53-binding protein 1 [Brienomyrus brachyistius]
MDPGGSDLEPDLSQLDNPCLIVEDSQPDSAALEEDPDSSYRALLTRRLSSLQPTSHSPVLELISSPAGSRCSQIDSQSAVAQSSRPHSPATMESSSAQGASQVLEVAPPTNRKRDLPAANGKQSEEGMEMESRADSTTPCVQSEGGDCFGFLELSESQAVDGGLDTDADGRGPALGGAEPSRAEGDQGSASRRSEVSSSCREGTARSVREARDTPGPKPEEIHQAQKLEDDSDVPSSQDDMFEVERGDATGVDSTVPEAGLCLLPTATPANSLHLLHLSGQGTLVQESLSQSSVEFVAPTQDRLSQTPLIVPNSPTAQDEAVEEPMDTSLPPEEPRSCHREEEPMDMDQALSQSSAVPRPGPAASTPLSQNSPGFALEKSLSMPSQPDFSHDVFVPTLSQGDGKSRTGSEALMEKVSQATTKATPSEQQAGVVGRSQPSLCLELSTSSPLLQPVPEQEGEQLEDSQATQIEEPLGVIGSVPTLDVSECRGQHEEVGDPPTRPPSQLDGTTACAAIRPDGEETRRSTDDVAREPPSEANGPDAKVVTETIDLTTAAESQAQAMVYSQNGSDSAPSQKAGAVDLTASEAPVQSPPVAAHGDCGSASQTPSQSVLPSERPREEKAEDVVMEIQPRSSEACEELGSEASRPEHDEGMDEGEAAKGSGLCLALSQSQVLSPEPMEEDGHLEREEQGAPMEASTSAREVGCHGSSEVAAEVADESRQINTVMPSRSDEAHPPTENRSPQDTGLLENLAKKKPASTTNGMDGPGSLGPRKAATQGAMADGGVAPVSGGTPSDTSGEIPFHFTLPKEGELIHPVTTATPPLINQLKQTPRHSTPIEMSPFSERLPGDVTAEVAMAASEITVEESGEDGKNDSNLGESEHNGKLSLRMKLVTPVEETSSGSERFSLQKPALADNEVSVSKVTTVVKAVTSPLPSPSVFSRVCEVRRQAEAPPSEPGTPTRGDLFNSPLSQTSDSERDVPGLLAQKPKSLPRCSAVPEPSRPGDRSPRSQQDGPRPTEAAGGEVREEEPPGTPRDAGGPASPRRPEGGETPGVETSRTPPGRRAVSQQTSFDASPGLPSRLHQRAVSQQTSFEALEPQFPAAQGEPETPPRPSHGQAVRRHVRTIREVRTTVTRIITDVYYENGQEVDRKVTEESEEPLVDCRVVENDVSPSRTGSSMTSGDLADVSSLSSKASSLQHSSSGTSSGGAGPGRQADFVVPVGRGAKSLSPRKMGGQQGAPWGPGASELIEGRGRAQGPRPHTPLTPRGRGRRGRPPSRGALSRAAQGSALTSSPEDESYTRVRSRAEDSPGVPDSPSTPSDGTGCASSSSFVGLRVVAKWSSNGYFYSGCITRHSGAGRFRLLFDDRYECDVPGKDILLCDPIPPGTEVTAISEDEYFSTGVVRDHKTEGSDFFYCVEKDGQRKWYGRMAVILSMEQGNRLREQYGLGPYEPTTPLTKATDISLDNLVEGKRKRRGNAGVNTTPGQSSSDSPRTPGPSGKRKLMASMEEERTPSKRGRRSAGARAGQRGDAFNTSGSGTDLPSDPNDLEETHGPIPQSASLFLGYAFLLTASSELDREANHPTSDAEEEFVQTAPYNKRYTETQLEAGGGYVLRDFNEQQCSAAYQSILIADQQCRTRKYLLCLASGMPCVSHMWVRDCCHDNQLLSYRSYLLPAGMGPDGNLVEWHSRRNPFKSMRFLLISEEATAFLTDLLNMGGASSVRQYQGDSNNSDPPEGTFDVVLADRSCPPSVQSWAISLDLPLLSSEWLIQSLICGEKQDHRVQPRYQYDYSP